MKQRLFILPFLLMAWLLGAAQSPAAKIKEIQKDTKTYIFAESTSPSEDEAYANALRQLVDMSINFVNTNADGAKIDETSVESLVEKITIPRGDFHRVFLYVSRDALLGKSSSSISPIVEPEPTQESDLANSQESTTIVEEFDALPDIQEEETVEVLVPVEIKNEIVSKNNVSGLAGEMIGKLLQARNLQEAVEILSEYKDKRVVVDFGVSRDARNSQASFWVVEDNGALTVLGPEIKGYRNNYKTGTADALYKYSKGMWFRKK